MGKLLSVLLLLVSSALASIKYDGSTNDFACTAANILIAGNLSAMTVTAWVNLHSTTVGVFSASADNAVGGWKFDDEGANATDNLAFVKSHIVVVSAPASLALAQNTWTFVAAVVTSTQVHFYMLVGNTATTGDTSNSASFAAAGANGKTCQDVVISGGSTVLQPLSASLGETCAWATTALTDAQLHMIATQGCRAIGILPTAHWPSHLVKQSGTIHAADVKPPGTYTFTNTGGPPVNDSPPPLAQSIGAMR